MGIPIAWLFKQCYNEYKATKVEDYRSADAQGNKNKGKK